MPILECILIDASTDEIKLTANDMELGIETKVEGDILEKGKIALDAKLFSEIARKLSDSDSLVTIESDEKFNTVITIVGNSANPKGQPGSFPQAKIRKNHPHFIHKFSTGFPRKNPQAYCGLIFFFKISIVFFKFSSVFNSLAIFFVP